MHGSRSSVSQQHGRGHAHGLAPWLRGLHEIDVIFKLLATGIVQASLRPMLRDTRHPGTRPDFVVLQNRTRGKQKKEEDSANNAV